MAETDEQRIARLAREAAKKAAADEKRIADELLREVEHGS